MQGIGILLTIVIGGLAGWIAEKLTKSDHGLLTNIGLGIAGAFSVSALAGFLGIPLQFAGWFWGNLITAVIGAVLLIWLYRTIKSKNG